MGGLAGRLQALRFRFAEGGGRINPRPILFIAVEGDKRMPPSIARELYSQSSSPGKRLVVVPGHRHGEGFKSGNS